MTNLEIRITNVRYTAACGFALLSAIRHSPRFLMLLCVLLVSSAAGCQAVGIEAPELPRVDLDPLNLMNNPSEQTIDTLSGLVFPEQAELGDDLDMLVIREGKSIRINNRTPRSYGDVYLWLNRQYVARVPRIAIGPKNRIYLRGFINQHRESFPVAEFLAPDKAAPVVAADLFDPVTGRRHRIVVRLEEDHL